MIKNINNNKVYIGESLKIEQRWIEHIKDLINNKHHSKKLQSDFNKYGLESFEFEILEELNLTESPYKNKLVLLVYERKYINKYNSMDDGYNVEDTLGEVIQCKKTLLEVESKKIKENTPKVIGQIIRNMKENDGNYNPNYKLESNKENNYLKVELSYTEQRTLHKDLLTFKQCIYMISKDYNITTYYNNIFKKFRELNIFNYVMIDDKKYNSPTQEYIDKGYFVFVEEREGKKVNGVIKVTKKGLDFVKEKLAELDFIDI